MISWLGLGWEGLGVDGDDVSGLHTGGKYLGRSSSVAPRSGCIATFHADVPADASVFERANGEPRCERVRCR